ncbi:Fic/DOC family protein [Ruminococcus albus]|uniref:Fic/DOC family protein n=2 Tax=Ruminococcus albus TaxID=1264 RepID=A0A1I1R7Z7_RUMAL|nr:Fic/DOC family protein [Ruminococcus albus]
MKRAENQLDAKQVLSVIEKFNTALDLLDAYDHQTLDKPKGNKAVYILDYDECRKVINEMKFASDSALFGNENDDSFKGSIANIYQEFGGVEIYPSLEEKAANLLYFVTKNHSFSDGNKRIAAAIFLYFLDQTLAALTIMIAESQPTEKEMMIKRYHELYGKITTFAGYTNNVTGIAAIYAGIPDFISGLCRKLCLSVLYISE